MTVTQVIYSSQWTDLTDAPTLQARATPSGGVQVRRKPEPAGQAGTTQVSAPQNPTGTTHRPCWICHRRLPLEALTFVQVEDDGCGENECTDRRDCILAAEIQAAPRPWASLLGKNVEVRLDAAPSPTIVSGKLLGFGNDGEFEVQSSDGFVHYCWPMLHVKEVAMPEIDPEETAKLRQALEHAQRATQKSQVYVKSASAWAYEITAAIVNGIEQGIVSSRGDRCPMDVASFDDLHLWCDANMYLIDMIPGIATWDTDEECARVTAFANLITDEITRLLRERADYLHSQGVSSDDWPGEDS